MIRIVENNDWVILAIVLMVLVYLMMMRFLQRDASLVEFVLQNYSDATNAIFTWVVVSAVFCVSYGLVISQFVPTTPRFLDDLLSFSKYSFSKFGFFVITIMLFYFLKASVTYFYYASIGEEKKWKQFAFASQKYFFVWSLLFMLFSILHYYFLKDNARYFEMYLGLLGFFTVMKLPYYFLHRQKPLPKDWYHKILYICTIQILPELAVWKFLFI